MRKFVLLLVLVLMATAVRAAVADGVVDIFRIETDNPGHGSYAGTGYGRGGLYGGLGGLPSCYRGTVWFRNTAGDELHDVRVKVTLFDRKQYVSDNSHIYAVGTVNPSQIVAQNFRIWSGSDDYLVPVVEVSYVLNGVKASVHTSPSDSYH